MNLLSAAVLKALEGAAGRRRAAAAEESELEVGERERERVVGRRGEHLIWPAQGKKKRRRRRRRKSTKTTRTTRTRSWTMEMRGDHFPPSGHSIPQPGKPPGILSQPIQTTDTDTPRSGPRISSVPNSAFSILQPNAPQKNMDVQRHSVEINMLLFAPTEYTN